MAKTNLTEAVIARLVYDPEGPSRQVTWDAKETGFGCRVTPAEGKSFVLLYRFNGRPRLMSLGLIERWESVKQARARAHAIKAGLTREENPVDPLSTREHLAAAATLAELFQEYERAVLQDRGEHSQKNYRSMFNRHILKKLGTLKPAQITKGDIVRLHDHVSRFGGKVIANRCVERLSGLLNWSHERSERNFPTGWANPCRGVKKHQEFARKHVLDAAQLRSLIAALEQEPNDHVRSYIGLIVLTGARQGELRRLRWPDVNLSAATAQIGKSKNGEDITLRLSPSAVAILKALPIIEGTDLVFPGRPISQPMTEPRTAYKAALKRAGLAMATTFHDLRRSFGTHLAMLGYSEVAIAAALNNTTGVAAKHYVNIAGSLVREATNKHEQALLPRPEGAGV